MESIQIYCFYTEAHWGHSFLNDLWLVRFRNRIVPFPYQTRLWYRIPIRYRILFSYRNPFDIEFDSDIEFDFDIEFDSNNKRNSDIEFDFDIEFDSDNEFDFDVEFDLDIEFLWDMEFLIDIEFDFYIDSSLKHIGSHWFKNVLLDLFSPQLRIFFFHKVIKLCWMNRTSADLFSHRLTPYAS